MLGTNDSKPFNWDPEDYRAGLEELIDTYREQNPSALVYLMTLPHAYEYNGPNAEGCAAIAQYVYEQIQGDVRAIQPQQ